MNSYLRGAPVLALGGHLAVMYAARMLSRLGADARLLPSDDLGLTEYDYSWSHRPPSADFPQPRVVLAHHAAVSSDEILAWINEGSSVVLITGAGDEGDLDCEPLDLLVAHEGGYAKHLVWSSDNPASDPPRRGPADQMLLLTGTISVLAVVSLLASEETSIVEVSSTDVVTTLLLPELADANEGRLSETRRKLPGGSKVAGGLVGLMRTADGLVIISPREQHQWHRLMELVGGDLADDPRFQDPTQRLQAWDELKVELEERWGLLHTSNDIFRSCQDAKVACFPLRKLADTLADEHLRARGYFAEDGRTPGLPIRVVARATGGQR